MYSNALKDFPKDFKSVYKNFEAQHNKVLVCYNPPKKEEKAEKAYKIPRTHIQNMQIEPLNLSFSEFLPAKQKQLILRTIGKMSYNFDLLRDVKPSEICVNVEASTENLRLGEELKLTLYLTKNNNAEESGGLINICNINLKKKGFFDSADIIDCKEELRQTKIKGYNILENAGNYFTYDYNKVEKFNFTEINEQFLVYIKVNANENFDNVNKLMEYFNNNEKVFSKICGVYIVYDIKAEEDIAKLSETNEDISNIIEQKSKKYTVLFHKANAENIFPIKSNSSIGYIIDSKYAVKKYKKFPEFTSYCKNFFLTLNETDSKALKKTAKQLLLNTLLSFFYNLHNLNYSNFFGFTYKLQLVPNDNFSNFASIKLKDLQIFGLLKTKDYLLFAGLLEKASAHFSEKSKDTLKEMPTVDINISFENSCCAKCAHKIPPNKETFYCIYCEVFYCAQCVFDQIVGNYSNKDKYIDQQHNLIYFKTRRASSFKNICEYKLGANKFKDNLAHLDFNHSAICNGCSGNFSNSARFICLHCRDGKYNSGGFFDYCTKCVHEMARNSEKGKKMQSTEDCIDNDKMDSTFFGDVDGDCKYYIKDVKYYFRHNHEEHIYLMLICRHGYGNYANY